jgi:hypothetical protein
MFLSWGAVLLQGQAQIPAPGEKLYLLAGTPTPKLNLTLPVDLYVAEPSDNSLVPVRRVVPKEEGTASIHVDLSSRLISMDSPALNPHTVRVLHMDEVSKIDSRALVYADMGGDSRLIHLPGSRMFHTMVLSEPSFDRPNKSPMTPADFAPGLWRRRLVGFDLSPGANPRLLEVPQTDFKYVVHAGHPGSGIWAEERLDGAVDADGKTLMIWVAVQKVSLDVPPPQGARLKSSSMISYHVINPEIIAFTIEDNEKGAQLSSPLYVYTRSSGQWSEFPSSGRTSILEGFGHWIVATYTEDNENTPGRVSPGKGRRPSKRGEWSADDRFKMHDLYFPGILLIYDTQHHVRYSIETGEGDSEVLLVQGGILYYRVNDQVYRAEAYGGMLFMRR